MLAIIFPCAGGEPDPANGAKLPQLCRAVQRCERFSLRVEGLAISLGGDRIGGVSVASNVDAAAQAPDQRLAEAHRALIADRDIQFDLPPVKPRAEPPSWLKEFFDWLGHVLAPVGRFFEWIGRLMPEAPYARIALWTMLALAGAALIWMIVDRIRHGVWRLPTRRRPARAASPGETAGAEEDWRPDAAVARALLSDADALAAEGRFAEAAHLLLRRSIDEVDRRRPRLLRPSLTSRDIAAEDAIPRDARTSLAGIVAVVERSLFGGRPVAEGDWRDCRAAYSRFALPGAWA
jgi:hypothetical protein